MRAKPCKHNPWYDEYVALKAKMADIKELNEATIDEWQRQKKLKEDAIAELELARKATKKYQRAMCSLQAELDLVREQLRERIDGR
jgi:di/tripeptidase